jgi:hypothetical protein
LTYPSLVVSTSTFVVSTSMTNMTSSTVTYTVSTDVLAVAWSPADSYTLMEVVVFAIICVGLVMLIGRFSKHR